MQTHDSSEYREEAEVRLNEPSTYANKGPIEAANLIQSNIDVGIGTSITVSRLKKLLNSTMDDPNGWAVAMLDAKRRDDAITLQDYASRTE